MTNNEVIVATNHMRSKQRDEPIIIPRNYLYNLLKAREKSRVCVQVRLVLIFAYHWLKNCREIFKPTTKRSNRNRVSIFGNHLKTVLI